MQRLTLCEVNEKYGGKLPVDAVFRSEVEPEFPSLVGSNDKPSTKRKPNRSKRFSVFNAFADMGMTKLTGAEVKVWIILFRDTKANGVARTGQADIARRAGLTVRGVQKALDKLQAKELIRTVKRGRLNQGPSSYRVLAVGS